jgi:cytochrome c peroxidase
MSSGEMACANRSFDALLAKLAKVTPLALAKGVPLEMKAAISAANSKYANLFSAAFPGSATPISAVHFAFAIATHERHLRSDKTPWDLYNRYLLDPKAGDGNALTPAQIRGFQLFMGKAGCNGCHKPPFFSDFKFHNLHFVTEKDPGRQGVPGHTGDPPHQVKTATLRNVGLREAQGLFHYGYGPGLSLDAVLAWYNIPPQDMTPQDIQQDPALAAIKRLDLTPDEIADMLDFLRHGLTDPRVKDQIFPFDKPTLSTE